MTEATAKRRFNPKSLENLRQHRPKPASESVQSVVARDPDIFPIDAETPILMPIAEPSVSGQGVTLSLVQSGAAEGAVFLRKLVKNAKAGLRLRYEASCRLIEFAGFGQKAGAPPGAAVSEDALLGRITDALQLRARTVGAVDAQPIREESVIPATSFHSQKAPDKQSD